MTSTLTGNSRSTQPRILRPNRDAWASLATEFRDHNFRQCWEYAAAMGARSNAQVDNLAIRDDESVIGLASVRIKRMPGLGTGIAYVSGGPLVRHPEGSSPQQRLEIVLGSLKQEYVESQRLLLRIEPRIGDETWNRTQEGCYEAAGFVRAKNLHSYRTMLVDIARPRAEQRSRLAQKWRNSLNKADRAGIQVTEGTDSTLFDDFESLFNELIERKEISVELGADFYADLQTRLSNDERLYVAIASVDGAPAAGVVASLLGDTAVYLLGASNAAGRELNAAYLLQWTVMGVAAGRGCRWYDLGGVDAEGNPGVYRFKARMGGAELLGPGPYEIAPDRLRKNAVRTAERMFRVASSMRPR